MCVCVWLGQIFLVGESPVEPPSNLNMVSTLPGKFSSLPAMLPCMTLTCLSFHNLESDSPTFLTAERETIVHGVILSVGWCAQLPLRFAAFLLSFSGKSNSLELFCSSAIWNWAGLQLSIALAAEFETYRAASCLQSLGDSWSMLEPNKS